MILKIKNLGPLKKGEVNISKNILFFVGFNNSGKTYLTQLIWGIYNEAFYREFIQGINVNKISRVRNINNFKIEEKNIEILLNEYKIYIKDNIHRIFKSEKKYFSKFEIDFAMTDDAKKLIANGIDVKFTNTLDKDDVVNITTKSNNKKLEINITKNTDLENIKRRIIHFLLLGLFEGQSFYLPSIRGAYTTFYQYIYKIEKDKKDKIDDFMLSEEKNAKKLMEIVEQYKPSYTLAMNELISKMISLKQENITNKEYIEFQERIEKLIGGTVNMTKSQVGQKEIKLKIKNGHELPMYLVSSNSNQLTTLYLYFKYWIEKKDKNFLILDEPEENLHPQNQYEIMNIMMDFVAKGNKLLLTTHSSLLAKIINNYITYSQLNEKNKERINNKYINSNINKDDIEICFFDGEQVKHYDIEEYGVVFKDFLAIENEIASLSNEINIKLYEQGND
jgi:ABC-type transport system involved in cytochrome c biogenesis ATPase subunit